MQTVRNILTWMGILDYDSAIWAVAKKRKNHDPKKSASVGAITSRVDWHKPPIKLEKDQKLAWE